MHYVKNDDICISQKPLKTTKVMKTTSVYFNAYAVSDTDMQRVRENMGNLDSLFSAVKEIPGVGFLKMHGYYIDVLDVNSYPLLTISVDDRYEDSILYRF